MSVGQFLYQTKELKFGFSTKIALSIHVNQLSQKPLKANTALRRLFNLQTSKMQKTFNALKYHWLIKNRLD